jgi:hypothetical protein
MSAGPGIEFSLFSMASAAILTPALWVEPLGAVVKTGPAIVLMLVALVVQDERWSLRLPGRADDGS